VLLVVAGDADGDVVAGMVRSVRSAGGTLLGEVRIDPAVFDPEAEARLAGALDDVAADADVATSFGQELARRLAVVVDGVAEATAPLVATELLGEAFGDLEDQGLVDLLETDRSGIDSERLDVVLLTDRNLTNDPTPVLTPVLEIADGDSEVGVVVVAEVGRVVEGNDIPAPSFVALIRDDGRLRDEVATVDNAETFLGWIAAVLAIGDVARGEIGHFGFRDGADRSLPPAAP
jgi:hypothetical protein